MEITSLRIDGFGVWSGLELDRFGSGLNVVFGPNEAGKSTLLQFLRSMLYGLPAGGRYLPPVFGGDAGGQLCVRGSQGSLEILRRIREDREEVVVTAADGTRHGEHMLKVLAAGVDESIFNNVFAVGLREMQELGALSESRAAELLYGLSAGLDRVSLVEVFRALDDSRRRLLNAGDGADRAPESQVAQLLSERQRVRADIDELSAAGRHFAKFAAEQNQLQQEIAQLEGETGRLDQQTRVIELAAVVRPRWVEKQAVDAELKQFEGGTLLTDDLARHYRGVVAAFRKRQREREALRKRRRELREEDRARPINLALWRRRARIEALLEQRPWLANLQTQSAAIEDDLSSLEGQAAGLRQRLGLRAADREFAISGAPARLRPAARALRKAARALRSARAERDAVQQRGATLRADVARGLPPAAVSLSTALDEAGQRVALQRRRIQLEERIAQSERSWDASQRQVHALLGRQLLPLGTLAAFGAAFVLFITLVLVGVFLPGSIVGPLGMVMTALGIVGAGGVAAAKVFLERSHQRQLEDARRQALMLESQLRNLREERESLDRQAPRAAGPLAGELEAAERELAALEQLVPLDARLHATNVELEAASRRASESKQDYHRARLRWRESLARLGLSPELDPKRAADTTRAAAAWSDLQRRRGAREQERAERRSELDALATRIAQLADECGVEVATDDPDLSLQLLADAVAQEQSAQEARAEIRRQAQRLLRRQRKVERRISRLQHARRQALFEAGAASDEEFAALTDRAARVAALRTQQQALLDELTSAVAGVCSLESLAEQLSGDKAEQLTHRREALAQRLAGMRGELASRIERRGQLAEQLRTLVGDRRLAERQLDLLILDRRLRDALHRWRVLAIATQTLNSVRESYERERQPETLQEASRYLERLTEGRYGRVWTPLGERTLQVDDSNGETLPVEALSRGTREQLFLALRLALAAWYARQGTRLPLVLDDVLVNFDAARARAAADTLFDYASDGRQLLVFTCHEHILNLFQSLGASTCRLPDRETADSMEVRFECEPPVDEPRNSAATRKRRNADVGSSAEKTAAETADDATERGARRGARKRKGSADTIVAASALPAEHEEPLESDTAGDAEDEEAPPRPSVRLARSLDDRPPGRSGGARATAAASFPSDERPRRAQRAARASRRSEAPALPREQDNLHHGRDRSSAHADHAVEHGRVDPSSDSDARDSLDDFDDAEADDGGFGGERSTSPRSILRPEFFAGDEMPEDGLDA